MKLLLSCQLLYAFLCLFCVTLTADLVPLTDLGRGAGQGDGIWLQPCVDDFGRVAFTAPTPDTSLPYAWSCYNHTSDAEIFPGLGIFGTQNSHYELTYASQAQCFFAFRRQLLPSTNKTLFSIVAFGDQAPETPSLNLLHENGDPRNIRLVCAADASRLAVSTNSGIHVWNLADKAYTAIRTISTSKSTPSIALSGDGRYLFYTDLKNNATVVQAHDLEHDTGATIATIGDASYHTQLSCSHDGSAIAFSTSNGELTHTVGEHVVLLTRKGDAWSAAATISQSLGSQAQAREPSLSADGQTIVFTAQDTSTLRQLHLWQAAEPDTCQRLSASDEDCHTPALSPSGRHVAVVVAKADALPQIYTYASALSLSAQDVTTIIGKAATLPLKTNARPDATLSFSGTFPAGQLLDGTGAPVSFDAPLHVSQLPLSFTARAEGSFPLTITVSEGTASHSVEMTLNCKPAMLDCVTLKADGTANTDPYTTFSSLACSEDGQRLVFATTASLHDADTGIVSDIYCRDLRTGELTCLTSSDDFRSEAITCAISGDGQRIIFVCNGKLYADTGEVLASNVAPGIQPAINHDGSIIAFRTPQGALQLLTPQGTVTVDENKENKNISEIALNSPGTLLVYLKDKQLWACDLISGNPPFCLNDTIANAQQLSLTRSGATAAYIDDTSVYTIPVAPKAEPELRCTLAQAKNFRLSPNGRYLFYSKNLGEHGWQLYRRQLHTGEELCLTQINDLYGNGASVFSGIRPVSSANGENVFFCSMLTNLSNTPLSTPIANLFLSRPTLPPNTPPQLTTSHISHDETAEPFDLPLAVADSDHDDLLLSLACSTSAQGGTLTLLPPDFSQGRLQPHVRYTTPHSHFVGSDHITLLADDGSSTTELTLNLTILNVNDPPVWRLANHTITLQEGVTATWDAAPHADDPDLDNPAPDTDTLSYSLSASAPSWLSLNAATGLLTVAPGYDVATRTEPTRTFAVELTVTDLAGASAVLPLQVTVQHVNRAPVSNLSALTLNEDTPLRWQDLQLADPDGDDLYIQVASIPQSVDFFDCEQRLLDLAQSIPANLFPLTWKPHDGATNGETLVLRAVDPEDASVSLTLSLVFKRQSVAAGEWWTSTTTSEGTLVWTQLQRGWNLLSVPVDLDDAAFLDFCRWLGSTNLWAYRQHRFVPITAEAPPQVGEGFYVYLENAPQHDHFTFCGLRPFTPRPLPLGWSLRSRLAIPDEQSDRTMIFGGLPADASTPAWVFQRR